MNLTLKITMSQMNPDTVKKISLLDDVGCEIEMKYWPTNMEFDLFRMFAAAPDMYAVCRKVIEDWSSSGEPGDGGEPLIAAMAREALKKADGK